MGVTQVPVELAVNPSIGYEKDAIVEIVQIERSTPSTS